MFSAHEWNIQNAIFLGLSLNWMRRIIHRVLHPQVGPFLWEKGRIAMKGTKTWEVVLRFFKAVGFIASTVRETCFRWPNLRVRYRRWVLSRQTILSVFLWVDIFSPHKTAREKKNLWVLDETKLYFTKWEQVASKKIYAADGQWKGQSENGIACPATIRVAEETLVLPESSSIHAKTNSSGHQDSNAIQE